MGRYQILKKQELAQNVFLFEIDAPLVAKNAEPGQFIILRTTDKGERIPLTIADFNREKGSVTIIVQAVGRTTIELSKMSEGEYLCDFAGPLGKPTALEGYSKVAVIGGGLGTAIAYPQVKKLHELGANVTAICGFRSKDIAILENELRTKADKLIITTDDGSNGIKGFVTDRLEEQIQSGEKYDVVIAIGPMIMMKNVCLLTKKYNIPTIVSMNPIMIDGTGMCGGCRISVAGETKFACVDGPDFDGHQIDWDMAMNRSRMFKEHEQNCNLFKKAEEPKIEGEVAKGLSEEEAIQEAKRCLNCKNKPCMSGCPVMVKIPEFIALVAGGRFSEAYDKITETNSLPAITGRVCPQEKQCEAKCVRGIKGEPIAIGKLERFVADWKLKQLTINNEQITNGCELQDESYNPQDMRKIAVVGSGPSGLTCAGDLAKKGFDVTVFEALHEAGGVLMYGIPEFRLPKAIVQKEIDNLKKLGVKIQNNVIIGKTITIEDLQREFDAIFIGTGAGLPSFLKIEGENLNGIYSANEFLTRINLMKGYKFPDYDTPVYCGKSVAVFGGGNVAMDAARCAKRLGAPHVYIIYRRGKDELPARVDEVHHAEEEGVEFLLMRAPKRFIENSSWVSGVELIKTELGEADESGRRRPVEIEGSEYILDIDTAIIAIGQSPNPLITQTTKGLDTNKRGCIIANDDGLTSLGNIYAGGDAVTGAATVILAMGAGKKSAETIERSLQ